MSHQFLLAYQYSKMHQSWKHRHVILYYTSSNYFYLKIKFNRRRGIIYKKDTCPLCLFFSILNIIQDIVVVQINFSSNIVPFHIFEGCIDPEIDSKIQNLKIRNLSLHRSFLVRKEKQNKKKKKTPVQLTEIRRRSKNPFRDFAKERRKKITDRAAAVRGSCASRYTNCTHRWIGRKDCTCALHPVLHFPVRWTIDRFEAGLAPSLPSSLFHSVPHHVWTFAPLFRLVRHRSSIPFLPFPHSLFPPFDDLQYRQIMEEIVYLIDVEISDSLFLLSQSKSFATLSN